MNNWTDLISGLVKATYAAPASAAAIEDCERRLGHSLAPDLKSLLAETDGVTGEYEAALIWPTARIAEANQRYRTDEDFARRYMPLDPLCFFADAGNGDLFGFVPRYEADDRHDIFAWNHLEDSRIWIASSLQDFLDGWLTGRITI